MFEKGYGVAVEGENAELLEGFEVGEGGLDLAEVVEGEVQATKLGAF